MSLLLSIEIILESKEVGEFFADLAQAENLTRAILEHHSSYPVVNKIVKRMTKNILESIPLIHGIDPYFVIFPKNLLGFSEKNPHYAMIIISEILKHMVMVDFIKDLIYPSILYTGVTVLYYNFVGEGIGYYLILPIFLVISVVTIFYQSRLFLKEIISALNDMYGYTANTPCKEISEVLLSIGSKEHFPKIIGSIIKKKLRQFSIFMLGIKNLFYIVVLIIVTRTLYMISNSFATGCFQLLTSF